MNLVVTGTSAGIGRALAVRLLDRGHRVWGLARSDQSDFAAAGKGAFRASRCDVAIWPQVEAAAAEIGGAWGHLDGLVCCAGSQGEIGRTVTADPRRWSQTARVNLEGTYFSIRAFHSLLGASRRAKIVCFSGGGAAKPRPNFSAYGSAKTAIVRLVETIAVEEGENLDINAIAPGAVTTRMTEEVLDLGPAVVGQAEHQAALAQVSKGGASPERAIALVEWLLSPASDGVSGRLISAPWDPWQTFAERKSELAQGELYTLRRVIPNKEKKA